MVTWLVGGGLGGSIVEAGEHFRHCGLGLHPTSTIPRNNIGQRHSLQALPLDAKRRRDGTKTYGEKHPRLRARAAPLQVAQDADAQLLACPRRTLQHERRPPCPCWLPAARDARPPACSAVHRAASRRSIESTSVRSRLQLEAVWADELTTILQLGLVRRTFYSTGSGPQILCACRAGDGSSKSTAGSWRSG